MLTNKYLLLERDHLIPGIGGKQRIYRFKNGHGLSLVNSPMLHAYPFAWEAAVLKGLRKNGTWANLDYSTPLTGDVKVFFNDEDANAFIQKAADYFNKGTI